ncbi:MAG: DEAD/DEAH box helicase [Crenarchaeota archaeon]|nr:DEAD/DEAH box helicase [Thermoproteota archaeon]
MRAYGSEEVSKLLPERILSLLEARGFYRLTPVQERAIPEVLKGSNVLIVAPTGSGKTEAAFLPALARLLELKERGELGQGIYVLYISPLRALNRDLLERLRWWCINLDLKIDVRHGDTDVRDRVRQSRDPPHILITTPETLQAVLMGRRLREHLKKLRIVIVDEIHELVEDKRGVQLVVTLERLRRLAGRSIQVVGLSATVGDPDTVARFLVRVGEPYRIVQFSHIREMILDVIYPSPTEEDVKIAEKIYATPDVACKLRVIRDLVEKEGPAIIFVNTRSMAENLAARFHAWLGPDYPISVHHGSLSKTVREGIERLLREGKLKAVIATSSLELGIDIGHINIVIQYTSPHQVTRLVQRVGRSGHRLDKVPKGVIIVHDIYDALESIVIVDKARRGYLEPVKIPEKPYDVMCNQIVACILTQSRWKIDELYDLFRSTYPYRDLTKEELLKVVEYMSEGLNPPLIYYRKDTETVEKPIRRRSRIELYRYFTNNLSMIPEEKQYYVINKSTGEIIGVLDEAFVAEYAQPGLKFVFRGKVWIIDLVTKDKIIVEEAKDPIGAIPAWIGEEIPVPYDIAQDVASLLGLIERLLNEYNDVKDVIELLYERLNINRDTIEKIVRKVLEHLRSGKPLPTDKRVVVENVGGINIIHIMLGTLGNKTLSKILAEYLSSSMGISLREYADPYAIAVESDPPLDPEKIRNALIELSKLSKENLEELIARTMIKSGAFKRRFIHVARRFNAIPKDADPSSISISSLIEAFKGTPVIEEAAKEYMSKDVDIEAVVRFLEKLRNNMIEIITTSGQEPSPLAREILERISGKFELTGPESQRMMLKLTFRSRLMNESIALVCLDCLNYKIRTVREILSEELKCEKCGSTNIGILKITEDKISKIIEDLRKGSRRQEIQTIRQMLEKTRELLRKYGKKTILAFCTKIPIEDLENILEKIKNVDNIDNIVEMLFNIEREYIRKRFFG